MNQHQRFQETVLNSRKMLEVSISLAMKKFEEAVKDAQSKFEKTISDSRHILMTSVKIAKQSLEDVILDVERKVDVPHEQNSDSATSSVHISNETAEGNSNVLEEEQNTEKLEPSIRNETATLNQTEILIKEEPLDLSYENTHNSTIACNQNSKRTFVESNVDSGENVSTANKKPKQTSKQAVDRSSDEQGPSTSGNKTSGAKNLPQWRSERSAKACYTRRELHGIVPDYIVTAFHADKDLVRLIIFLS